VGVGGVVVVGAGVMGVSAHKKSCTQRFRHNRVGNGATLLEKGMTLFRGNP